MPKQFGTPLPDWTPPQPPLGEPITGAYVQLERMDPARHGPDLHRAYLGHDGLWDYLPYGPFDTPADYTRWAEGTACGLDPLFYVLRNRATGLCGGVASYLRITPASGSIEVGHINLSPEIAGSRVATEAMFLMMDWAFGAGYRRYEWKCDALNRPSRRAAQRLGFSYEGIFRQATVYRQRNRDTAWFSIIDTEWPSLRTAYQTWLALANFDTEGRQKVSLAALTGPLRGGCDPAL
jgi:RimJ/RimL family protein N-acetyltransferase